MDNNQQDQFAPPSKEELALFAPPTQEEHKEVAHLAAPTQSDRDTVGMGTIESQEQEQFSPLESAGLGATQGASFGFGDELEGAVRGGYNKLTGEKGNLIDLYRKYQQLAQSRNEEAKRENPGSFTTGELAGGLATIPLVPELGVAAKLGTIAETVGTPGIAAALAGKSGSTLANLAGKGVSSFYEGIPLGAAFGAGTSKHNLIGSTREEEDLFRKDVEKGIATGSITGAALSLGAGALGITGSNAVKKAEELAEETPYLRNLKESWELGKKGTNLAKASTEQELAGSASNAAGGMVDKIMEARAALGQKVGAALDNAQAAGVEINVTDALKSAAQSANEYFSSNPAIPVDPKSRAVLRAILNNQLDVINPIEAKGIKDNINQILSTFKGVNTEVANTTRQMAGKLSDAIDSELKAQIPDYRQAADQFYQFNKMIPETILNPGVPMEYNQAFMGSMSKKDQGLFNATKDLLEKAMLPGTANKDYLETFNNLSNHLRQLESDNPAAIEALGGKGATADDIIDKIRDSADTQALFRQYYGYQPETTGGAAAVTGVISDITKASKGVGLYAANKAGLVSGSPIVKYTSDLLSMPEAALRGVSAQLKATDIGRHYGESLENALNNKNEALKNAVLFSILQNPNLRNGIGASLTGENKVGSSGQQQ